MNRFSTKQPVGPRHTGNDQQWGTLHIRPDARPIRQPAFPAVGGIEAETKMALAKMESVLKAAGCEKEDVVMCRIYVSSMDYWGDVNKVYSEFFGEHKPARRFLIMCFGTGRGCRDDQRQDWPKQRGWDRLP